jgi:ribose transport system permease protein
MSDTSMTAAPPQPVEQAPRQAHGRNLARRVLSGRQSALTLVAIILFAYFSIAADRFLTLDNMYDIARGSSFLIIVAVALTFLFIAGEIDFSVGSQFAFAGVFMGLCVVNWHIDPWLAALLTVGAGAAVGVVNGFLVTIIGVPSFIVTLGMYSLLRGLALVITGALAISFPEELDSSFFSVANGMIGSFPTQILWAVGALLLGGVVLALTRFGAHVYAVGGDLAAARAAGINTIRVKWMCFVLTGAACGVVAALNSGWLRQSDPTTGNGFELQVIAAVIVGGVALQGGEGSIYGTFVGAAIIGMIANGLILLGVQAEWNQVLVGVIIVAVAAGELGWRRRKELADGVRRRVRQARA